MVAGSASFIYYVLKLCANSAVPRIKHSNYVISAGNRISMNRLHYK